MIFIIIICTFSTVLSFMHFNAVLLCYVILCPSTLVIRICIFLSYRITNCIYVVILLILLTIHLFIFSTGLDYF